MASLDNVAGAFGFRVPGKSASPGTDHMEKTCRGYGIETTVALPAAGYPVPLS